MRARRFQHLLLGLIIGSLDCAAALAAEGGLNAQRFRPRWGSHDLLSLSSSRVDGGLALTGGLLLGYAHRPLVLVDPQGALSRVVVGGQLMADLGVAAAFEQWLEASLDLPVALYQYGAGLDATGAPDAGALGDLRLDLKLNLWGKDGGFLGLALVPSLTLPTGTDGFLGERSVSFTPRLVADLQLGRLRGVLNLDYTWREAASLALTTLDQELLLGLGAAYVLIDQVLEALAELTTATNITRPFASSSEAAAELLVGARARPGFFSPVRSFKDEFVLELAAATGLAPGVGTPVFRVLAGLAWMPMRGAAADTDGDGVIDALDRCPDQAEDPDGFDDGDGCPDTDNDGDDLPDAQDKCPGAAEDYDGFEDDDGCPEEGTPPPQVRIANRKIEISDRVYFESGSDQIIIAKSQAALDAVLRVLNENPGIEQIEIQGHTDDRGSAELNLRLSQQRAEAVLRHLTGRGVAASRLTAKGYGESQPIAPNSTARGQAANRRVEFQILKGGPAQP